MENIQEIITNMATIITSGGVILAFALKIGKKILDKSLKPFNEKLEEMDNLRVEQHKETIQMITDLKENIDTNDIDTVRNRICAFEQICRLDINNNNIKLHQYKTYFKDRDKWKHYHELYPDMNGEIDAAIEYIDEHYKKAKF